MRMTACLAVLLGIGAPAPAQVLISTGGASGLRLYYPNSNDWWLDPSQGRLDVRLNGNGFPSLSLDSAGALTASSQTLTAAGSAAPFVLTASSGVHILSGRLKLEPGAWLEYGDGSVVASSAPAVTTVAAQTVASTSTASIPEASASNTSWAGCNIPGSTVTIQNMGNNRALVLVTANLRGSASTDVFLGLVLDGAFVKGESAAIGLAATGEAFGGAPYDVSFTYLTDVLAAGSHSICLGAWASAGTWTFGNSASGATNQMAMIEVETGGTGASLPASTFTILTADYRVNETYGVSLAGSTISLVMSGGALSVTFMADIQTYSAATDRVAVLLDGQFIGGATSSAGNCTGQHGAANRTDFPCTISWTSTYTLTGAHFLSVTADGDVGGQRGLYCAGKMPCWFYAQEVKMAAGSGDVTANANNTLTGTNNFSAATMVGGGLLRQFVSSSTAAQLANVTAAAVPHTGAVPTITEGFQVLSATITPLNAASNIIVEADVNWDESTNNTNYGVLCLFKNNAANAVYCAAAYTSGSPCYGTTRMYYREPAGGTSSINYSIRLGADVGNSMGINETGGVAAYGGALISWMHVSEIAGP